MFQVRRNKDAKEVSTQVLEDQSDQSAEVENKTAEQHAVMAESPALLRREDMVASMERKAGTTGGAILGRGCKFEGKLSFDGTVQIDGEFFGDIVSEGHLVVSQGAKIDGNVMVASAVVSGEVTGKVHTSGTLELSSTARLEGELVVASLTIERGAHFQGEVKMTGG
ncbi:MAG: polymer-forming cytoskeletal protein [Myxococcota bacterium]|nr:polymer-forming cytoskeletal protein [Myxococcota bacterium]